CGGHGTCKKCKVNVLDGPAEPSELDVRAFTREELRGGWRLACRALAVTDATVEVPPLVTRPKAATVGVGRQVILRPAVQKRYLELDEPSLADQATDLERVLAQLEDLEPRADLAVLRTLGRTLREADYKVTAVVVDDVLIAVEPGEVYEVAVAGNATMTHLVLGIDPEPLGMAPFIMTTRLYPEILAADLGLGGFVHPRARAMVFPAFGAYVGGDITSGLLASGM